MKSQIKNFKFQKSDTWKRVESATDRLRLAKHRLDMALVDYANAYAEFNAACSTWNTLNPKQTRPTRRTRQSP